MIYDAQPKMARGHRRCIARGSNRALFSGLESAAVLYQAPRYQRDRQKLRHQWRPEGATLASPAHRLQAAFPITTSNALARLIGGDRRTPFDCMVSNLNAVNGDFRIQAMVLDTPKVNVHGSGNVRMDTEALNVALAAESKDFSLASCRRSSFLPADFPMLPRAPRSTCFPHRRSARRQRRLLFCARHTRPQADLALSPE